LSLGKDKRKFLKSQKKPIFGNLDASWKYCLAELLCNLSTQAVGEMGK
jgi:hypothetical protein